jgi:hypothetical protein
MSLLDFYSISKLPGKLQLTTKDLDRFANNNGLHCFNLIWLIYKK